ncbi:MAG: RNA 2',3'-cyclic phosphodiesterase [Candidatus Yanofskybacteria bacterium]|nr:RNA 2',3'-cyclic phosphodiesterase [Candidatus Yanofskybacteria bacterium]
MLHRIFIAITVPEKLKQELLSYQEKWPELPARWAKSANLHITLAFLGNRSDQEVEQLRETLASLVALYPSFSLEIDQILYGPSASNPRMVWARIAENANLIALQKEISKRLLPSEPDTFFAHVTLARLNTWKMRELEELPELDMAISLSVPVRSVEIMESRLNPRGATYTVMESIPLKH